MGRVVGPGAPIDTDRYFVVCPNVLGGCQGTTGPSSWAPERRPYGSRFPVVTVKDQVAVERALAAELGIETWYAVDRRLDGRHAGPAMGCRPSQTDVERAVVVATGAAASAEQIALCFVQNQAIRLDPDFHGGDYYDAERGPVGRPALARAIGHVSYRSEVELQLRFGNQPRTARSPSPAVATRSSPTSSITATSSSAVSTPTAISCSARR